MSNATATLDWAFDNLDIRKYFDEVIISSYEKCAKPNKKLYHITLSKLNKEPGECIFVDDKIENIEAASNIGIRGYHLDRKNGSILIDFEKYLTKL